MIRNFWMLPLLKDFIYNHQSRAEKNEQTYSLLVTHIRKRSLIERVLSWLRQIPPFWRQCGRLEISTEKNRRCSRGDWIIFLKGAVSLGLTNPCSLGGMFTSSWDCVTSRSLSGSICSPQAWGTYCRGKWNFLKSHL
jgi:hypothetical protein